MSIRRAAGSQDGFTLPELVIVMVISLFVSISLLVFSENAIKGYFILQGAGTRFGQLAYQTQRVTAVVRGLTDITEASSDDLTIYAYFYPSDTYVSLVHYYKNAAGNTLYADVTPMTANPPNGTPITAQLKTYKIIDNLFINPTVKTFVYLDSAGNTMAVPLSDLHLVKSIQINLAVPGIDGDGAGNNSAMSTQVELRNRKTNL